MIPKMDYLVVTKSDMKTLEATLKSIRKQTNVHRIILVQSINGPTEQFQYIVDTAGMTGLIDRVIMEDKGLAYARKIGIEEAQTKYFVFVDADVVLPDDWIQDMWLYMRENTAIHGRLYRNDTHRDYLRYNELLSLSVNIRMFTHNTIIKKDAVEKWKPSEEINAFEDYHLTQHIIENGGSIKVVPVLGFHNHQGSDFKAALWAGAGARQTGRFKKLRHIVWSATKMVGGGVKRTLKTRKIWFMSYGIKQGVGLVFGYLLYKRYRHKGN